MKSMFQMLIPGVWLDYELRTPINYPCHVCSRAPTHEKMGSGIHLQGAMASKMYAAERIILFLARALLTEIS